MAERLAPNAIASYLRLAAGARRWTKGTSFRFDRLLFVRTARNTTFSLPLSLSTSSLSHVLFLFHLFDIGRGRRLVYRFDRATILFRSYSIFAPRTYHRHRSILCGRQRRRPRQQRSFIVRDRGENRSHVLKSHRTLIARVKRTRITIHALTGFDINSQNPEQGVFVQVVFNSAQRQHQIGIVPLRDEQLFPLTDIGHQANPFHLVHCSPRPNTVSLFHDLYNRHTNVHTRYTSMAFFLDDRLPYLPQALGEQTVLDAPFVVVRDISSIQFTDFVTNLFAQRFHTGSEDYGDHTLRS